VRKSGRDSSAGFVNAYRVEDWTGLKTHEFASTDQAWLACVCAHRTRSSAFGSLSQWHGLDVLAGKVANDDTMTVINFYLADAYGPRDSEAAIAMAIGLLRPERLDDQVCLKTDRAVAKLAFVEATGVRV